VEKGVERVALDGKMIDLSKGPVLTPDLISGKKTAEVVLTMG
jgi:hypothetical protein